MDIKLDAYILVLLVLQVVCFFLPVSAEWWMRFFPALIACAFIGVSAIGLVMFFLYHLIRGIMIGMRRKRELLNIPEKEE